MKERIAIVVAVCSLVAVSLLSGCANSAAATTAQNPLIGAWRLVSYKQEFVEDRVEKEVYGPNPKGYYIFTDKRLMTLLAPADRKVPTNEAEAAAMLSAFTAYSATYKFDRQKFVFTPDISHNNFYVGKEQTRYYKLDGDKLSITTDPIVLANYPGKTAIGHIEFVCDR